MSNFFDSPTPLYHSLIMEPVYFCLLLVCDEYLLRRQPAITLYLAVISLIFVGLLGGVGYYERFIVIKAYSVGIPSIYGQLCRLGQSLNNSDSTINHIRFTQMKKYYRFIPEWFEKHILSKYFQSKTSEKYFGIFAFVLLYLNIIEALVAETFDNDIQSYNNTFNQSKWINIVAGLLCLITVPFPYPFVKYYKFYYFDTKYQYTDFIIDFPNGYNQLYQFNDYYIGFGWILLYTVWNITFVTRFYGYQRFISVMFGSLGIPFLRTLTCCKCYNVRYINTDVVDNNLSVNVIEVNENENDKEDKNENVDVNNNNNDKFVPFGIWLQDRTLMLWFYYGYYYPIRKYLIGTDDTGFVQLQYGECLLGMSLFGLFIGIIHTLLWYGWYLPHLKKHYVQKQEQSATV